MSDFVQGILSVQEEPYRNELELRLPDGEIIPVFYQKSREEQKEDALDALLESGKPYELLLVVRIRDIRYTATMPRETILQLVSKEFKGANGVFKRNDIIQGKVLIVSWNASSLHYQGIATPKIYQRTYMLLETAIGKIVVDHKALQEGLHMPATDCAPGGYLEWKPARLDLLAIIHKRDSEEQTL